MLHPALQRERSAVVAYLSTCAQRWRELLPLLVDDAGVEVLHDLRVQLRRVRSALRALDGALPVPEAASLAVECQWLAGRGSGLRDDEHGDGASDRQPDEEGQQGPVGEHGSLVLVIATGQRRRR